MKWIYRSLFALGIVLFIVNVTGLFRSMRNPELYELEHEIRNRVNDVVIKYPDIKKELVRRQGESENDFVVRVNSIVHDGFAHYWKTPGIEKYHMRVPVWENYLLWIASFIKPKRYERYEFSSYKKNLERGVGLCSSHSIVVKGVLKEHGIKAELLDVGGHHVVVRAELNDGKALMLDPDFGIVVPYDTADVTRNPELVRKPYSRMHELYYPDAKEPYTTEMMVDMYGKHKHVYNVNNWFEHFSYWAIWVIPALLMLPVIIISLRKKKMNA